jgi:hypothetical protein
VTRGYPPGGDCGGRFRGESSPRLWSDRAAANDPKRTFHAATVIFSYGRRPLRSVLHAETLLDLKLALNGVTDPMSPKTPLKSDDPAQPKRFIKDAHEAEADESDGTVKREFDKFIRGPRPKGPSPKQKNSR